MHSLSCKQFPCAGTLQAWHRDVVSKISSVQPSIVHGSFGGNANLKIGAGFLLLGAVCSLRGAYAFIGAAGTVFALGSLCCTMDAFGEELF